MMKEQENFDDLIRQKFAEKEFVFNEENWEKAEKKIDSTRRFRKIYLWTSIFIIGLFVGVGLTLLFIGKDKKENTKNISEINLSEDNKTESISKENTVIENPNSSLSPSQVNENTSTSQKTDAQEIPSEAESTSIINDDQKTEKGSSIPINTNIQTEKLNKNATNLSPTALIDQKNETIKTKKKNKISNAEAKLIAQKTVNHNNQAQKNISKKTEESVSEISKKIEDNSIVKEKNIEKNKDVASEMTTSKVETLNNEEQTKALNTEQNEKVVNTSETIAKDQSEKKPEKNNSDTPVNPITQEKEPVNEPKSELALLTENTEKKINTVADSSSPTEIILPEKALAIAKQDSSIVPNENKSIPPPPAPPAGLASATFFSVDAGTNFEFGWQYPDATEAAGFNPILGIGITHYINQKWALQSGLEYGSIAYLKASQKVFTNTTYGFGSTSVDKVINTKTLHYAIVPLLFQYHFNDKNAISIGGSISYLVNSKSKVTINTTTIAPMELDSNQTGPVENHTISTQSTETGYYSNAFNKWDASLAIGYRRRISQKFSLAAIANIGLLDVKDDAFFSREMVERNVGLKIVISYNLFEF
ncbi:MAG: outer membrane beta-barrel protein [Bacteroidota bacterium]